MTPPAAPPSTPPAASGRSPRRRRGAPAWRNGLLGLLGLVALFEIVPRTGVISTRYLPPFSVVAHALVTEVRGAAFWTALGETLRSWAIGLAIAIAGAVMLGLVIGTVPVLRAATASTIEFLRPIPSVALIPLAVLLFGSDLRSTLLLVVYAAFWQVIIQVLYGVQDVDPIAHETARSYGLGRLAELRHLTWPTALPYVMTGVRLGAAVALILTITGELVIGSPGLGKEIALAQSSGAVATMYALVIVTGLVGVAINAVARAVERRVLSWHPSVRAEVVA